MKESLGARNNTRTPLIPVEPKILKSFDLSLERLL